MKFAKYDKRLFSVLLLSVVFVLLSASVPRSEEKKLAIDDFQAPTSPAFIILGVAPSEVERPQTARAAAVSLISAFSQSEFMPNNLQIEFAPYWWAPRPDSTMDKPDLSPSVGRSALESLSISLATSRTEATDTSLAVDRISFGVRTLLKPGNRDTLVTRHKQYVKATAYHELCKMALTIRKEAKRSSREAPAVDTTITELKSALWKLDVNVTDALKMELIDEFKTDFNNFKNQAKSGLSFDDALNQFAELQTSRVRML